MTTETLSASPAADQLDTPTVTGGELVVRTLVRAGTECVYLLYGGHLHPICEAVRRHGLGFVDTRNEVTAGYAAEGYARASGSFGVALVSAAPGFTNVLTSMTNAHIDRTPVVYISTSAAMGDAETNNFMSGIDPIAMAKPITKWAHCATRTQDIPRLLAHAIRVATTAPTGPVLLDLPWDVVFGRVTEREAVIPETIQAEADPLPRPEAIDRALELLAAAQRPAIMVGEGALGAGVAEELRAFVATTGIPVFSSYEGFGLVPTDDPLHGGGLLKLVELRGSGHEPDVVLGLGIRLGFMTAGAEGAVPPEAAFIHVDVDARELGRTRDVAVGIASGTVEALRALNGRCAGHDWTPRTEWQRVVADARARRARAELEQTRGRDVPIPPYAAAQAIVDAVGPGARLVLDGADAHMWIAEVARKDEPGRLYSHHSFFGCLGYGLGFAIGVQNAHPDDRVVCVSGDGALGFTLAELHTLARHHVPVVVVVMNNRAWGATSHFQDTTSFGEDGYFGVDLSGARYDQVATALGCHGAHVTRLDELGPAIEEALASGRPACVNVEIAVEDVAPDHKLLVFLRS